MSQLSFFADQKRFAAWKTFHAENPNVWTLFKRFAYEALHSGRPRFSARMIGERIRWYTAVETNDPVYKINDHHWPYYARLIAGLDSRFETFFSFKPQRFDTSVEEICQFHMSLKSQ